MRRLIFDKKENRIPGRRYDNSLTKNPYLKKELILLSYKLSMLSNDNPFN